jgi:hypothetical protein
MQSTIFDSKLNPYSGTKMGTEAIEIVRKEGLSFPVRALVLIIDNLVLIPTFEFHSDW